mmetsp:Transcript_3175/g.9868  ORF Transcript_3175/g.9868 Transcript_3175/m.9868 type:complete len:621 (-) Transcript_3175:1156-3018(-)
MEDVGVRREVCEVDVAAVGKRHREVDRRDAALHAGAQIARADAQLPANQVGAKVFAAQARRALGRHSRVGVLGAPALALVDDAHAAAVAGAHALLLVAAARHRRALEHVPLEKGRRRVCVVGKVDGGHREVVLARHQVHETQRVLVLQPLGRLAVQRVLKAQRRLIADERKVGALRVRTVHGVALDLRVGRRVVRPPREDGRGDIAGAVLGANLKRVVALGQLRQRLGVGPRRERVAAVDVPAALVVVVVVRIHAERVRVVLAHGEFKPRGRVCGERIRAAQQDGGRQRIVENCHAPRDVAVTGGVVERVSRHSHGNQAVDHVRRHLQRVARARGVSGGEGSRAAALVHNVGGHEVICHLRGRQRHCDRFARRADSAVGHAVAAQRAEDVVKGHVDERPSAVVLESHLTGRRGRRITGHVLRSLRKDGNADVAVLEGGHVDLIVGVRARLALAALALVAGVDGLKARHLAVGDSDVIRTDVHRLTEMHKQRHGREAPRVGRRCRQCGAGARLVVLARERRARLVEIARNILTGAVRHAHAHHAVTGRIHVEDVLRVAIRSLQRAAHRLAAADVKVAQTDAVDSLAKVDDDADGAHARRVAIGRAESQRRPVGVVQEVESI